MKKTLFIFMMLSVWIWIYGQCFAQSKKGKIGISGSLQSLQTIFSIPYWYADNKVMAPSFGVVTVSDQMTDVALGAAFRIYSSTEKLCPNFGLRVITFIFIPKDGDMLIDYVAGIFGGSEYFFDEKFSIGGELQLNTSFSDEHSGRFQNPDGYTINTGMAINATFYFK